MLFSLRLIADKTAFRMRYCVCLFINTFTLTISHNIKQLKYKQAHETQPTHQGIDIFEAVGFFVVVFVFWTWSIVYTCWKDWHFHQQIFRCQCCADPWHWRNHLVTKVGFWNKKICWFFFYFFLTPYFSISFSILSVCFFTSSPLLSSFCLALFLYSVFCSSSWLFLSTFSVVSV